MSGRPIPRGRPIAGAGRLLLIVAAGSLLILIFLRPDRPVVRGPEGSSSRPPGDGLPSRPAALGAAAGRAVSAGEIQLRVTDLTSSGATLHWSLSGKVGSVRVLVSPEPPASENGALPAAIRIARLGPAARSYRLQGWAAGTTLFVRVEAVADATTRAGNLYLRFPGGPGAHLKTPLQAVQAYGTRVLRLVLANPRTRFNQRTGSLAGDRGSAWQQGTWTVRRLGGARIPVRAVHRESIPVGQPGYKVGYGLDTHDEVVDVEHRIFLTLGTALAPPAVLRIEHVGGEGTSLRVDVPLSDRYLETPLIQLNQVGYNPRATRRWAYVSGWMGDGGSVSLGSVPRKAEVLAEPLDPLRPPTVVLADLPVVARASADPDAGGPVAQIDLSRVPAAPGVRYRIRLPGVGVSWPTAVSEEATFKAFFVVARGLYHNRWCGDLDPKYTEWSRPADHCEAYLAHGRRYPQGFFPKDQPRGKKIPLRGGHHDAGDFDIRPFHVLVGQDLLRAFEMSKGRFLDGQLLLPESGNGIPDLLDEALWSLSAWQALQAADGSIHAGVESWRHPFGIYFANEDPLPYWTFDPEPWHTAYASALLAQGAYLVRPFDRARSQRLETDARRAYAWAVHHRAPAAYLLYASGELSRLTGEERFAREYRRAWKSIDKYGRGAFDNFQVAARIYPGAFTDYSPAMADFVMAFAVHGDGSDPIRIATARQLTQWANRAAKAILDSSHAHRNGREGTKVDWGQLTSTGRHADTIYQRLQLGGLSPRVAQDYFDALSLSADYVLGGNPAGRSFITGLGSRSPREPLHLDSLAFMRARGLPPIPGIPTYGPVSGYPGSSYYRPQGAAFYPPFQQRPLARRFADTRASVNMSEFSVWDMQAPLTLLFAALIGKGQMPPTQWRPGGAEHRATLPGHRADGPGPQRRKAR